MPEKNRKKTGDRPAPAAAIADSRVARNEGAAAPLEGERDRGRFRKGQSGNPRGRPPGAANRVTRVCADLLAEGAEELVGKVIEMAKSGDRLMLKLCIDRLYPARGARDRAVEFPVPAVLQAGDLATAAGAVIDQAAAGTITLSEAIEFMRLIEMRRKAIETAELAVRIEALETAAAVDPPARPMGLVEEVEQVSFDLARRVRRLSDGPVG